MEKTQRTWQSMDLSRKKRSSLLMMQIILILTFLWKGVLNQKIQGYTLSVSASSDVQRGGSLYIPCHFTYEYMDYKRGAKIFVYWFKKAEGAQYCFTWNVCFPGLLMATNAEGRVIDISARNHFYIVGDPKRGNCSFLITDAQPEHEGSYYLRIEAEWSVKFSYSSESYISPNILLTEPPQNIRIMRIEGHVSTDLSSRKGNLISMVAQEGDSVSLLCVAEGKPKPAVTWMKQKNSRNMSMESFLRFPQITSEDAGQYQCQVENNLGAIKATVRVIVEYAPRRVTFSIVRTSMRNPEHIHEMTQLYYENSREVSNGSQFMAQEGDSLRILCKAESYPAISASWLKPDRDNITNSTLEVTGLTLKDDGLYTCQAMNSQGSAYGIFQLYITYAPRLSRNPKINTSCWHQDNDFFCHCTLVSQPLSHIWWEVDGEALTGNNDRKNCCITSVVNGNEVTSSLNWTDSLEKGHTITCLGSNAFGAYSAEFLFSAAITSSFSTGSPKTVILSGLCGVLLATSLFLTGLFLIMFYKCRKAASKAGDPEVENSISGEHQRVNNTSLIYYNILPLGKKTPHVGEFKAPEEINPEKVQMARAPYPVANEADEVHYAALEFRVENRGNAILGEDSVDYSEIIPK